MLKYLSSRMKIIVFFILLVIFLLIQPFRMIIVKGDSMNPTYNNNDLLVAMKTKYGAKIKTRDVVVFETPEYWNTSKDKNIYIKRVVAKENDRVKMSEGKLIVNGKTLLDLAPINGTTLSIDEIVLNKDEFFVLGDNSPHSMDSLYYWIRGEKFLINTNDIKYIVK